MRCSKSKSMSSTRRWLVCSSVSAGDRTIQRASLIRRQRLYGRVLKSTLEPRAREHSSNDVDNGRGRRAGQLVNFTHRCLSLHSLIPQRDGVCARVRACVRLQQALFAGIVWSFICFLLQSSSCVSYRVCVCPLLMLLVFASLSEGEGVCTGSNLSPVQQRCRRHSRSVSSSLGGCSGSGVIKGDQPVCQGGATGRNQWERASERARERESACERACVCLCVRVCHFIHSLMSYALLWLDLAFKHQVFELDDICFTV